MFKQRIFVVGISLLALILIISAQPTKNQRKRISAKPNIILIVADDLGYSDLRSYGNLRINTPYIDSLGINGVKFTRAYVTSPICAPSRMGIMTGRYQNRFGSEFMPYDKFDPAFLKFMRKNFFSLRKEVPGLKRLSPHIFLNEKKYNTGLDLNEVTIAQLLKKNGYATGLVGKWNLGDDQGNHPYERGYDYSYYFDGALTRYVDDPVDTSLYLNKHLPWAFSELPAWQKRAGATAIREGKDIVKDSGYLTFSLADKGVAFIEKNKDHPFFLTLTFNAPHDPFQVPKSYFDRIKNVDDSIKRVYYGMIEALDDAVGKIIEKLREDKIEDQTLIIFLSDNGGATYTRATDNAPLRGGKCTHFEGGLMVPFFIKFPSMIQGSQVYEKPVSSLDIFATVAATAQASLATDRQYDGTNLMPYLLGHSGLPHEVFYWRSGYSKAICKGNWKLYINEKSKKRFLFDLSKDIEEKNDVSAKMPDKVNELASDLDNWEKTQTVKPAWPSAADVLIDVDGEDFYFPS
ncbi:MAG: sulfatase [Bacteroidetes bacterium]|nr:MAG: sulfatase [Bacteroidota bacterium]